MAAHGHNQSRCSLCRVAVTLHSRHKAPDERKTQNQKRHIPCHHAPFYRVKSFHDWIRPGVTAITKPGFSNRNQAVAVTMAGEGQNSLVFATGQLVSSDPSFMPVARVVGLC